MNTSLSMLPEHKQAELRAIVAALIPRFAEVEMIILFGSYARGSWVDCKSGYLLKSHQCREDILAPVLATPIDFIIL